MEEHGEVQGRRKRPRALRRAARRAVRPHAYSHPFELRRKAVQLCLEEGFPVKQVARELGVGFSTLGAWVRRYRAQGEVGLQGKGRPRSSRPQVAAAVKRQALELKRRHPTFGIQKISQFLRRVLFLPVSRETVRRTLHAHQLLRKPRPKPQRNPPRPRFFERATPNQLWQSDIFTFRLGGKNAYLIGFLDDHSRYVVGLDVFRSQTAEHVLEVYRRAVAEYGVPKEMLTDQGRQYSSWRGTTRFEAELKKDRVHHLKSRPHHPMTLGKIERFWKSLWEEFLVRAQFDSFEAAGERIRLWVQHYNHRRPHQALEGLCPADRFFAIAQELRQVQAVSYELEGGAREHGRQSQEGAAAVYCAAAGAGGAVALDRAAAPGGPLPGTGDQPEGACPLGRAGAGGDAPGAGDADAAGTGPRAEPEAGAIGGTPGVAAAGPPGQTGEAAGQTPRIESSTADQVTHPHGAGGIRDERAETQPAPASPGPAAGAADHAGAERGVECPGSRPATGDLPQDVLQVGAPGLGGDGGSPGQSGPRAPAAAARPGEGGPPAPDGGAPGEARGAGADGAAPAATDAAG